MWRRAGFDLGYFESEWSHFSIILNEIVFGAVPELRRLASELNSAILLPSAERALEILVERRRLAATGVDLEEADRLEPIEIFAR